MAKIKLENMSLKELKTLNRDVEKAITDHEKRQRSKALAEVEAKAREMGFTLAELASMKRKSGTKGVAKYRHPDDASKTWSGRGRQPAWYKQLVASGTDPENLLIG